MLTRIRIAWFRAHCTLYRWRASCLFDRNRNADAKDATEVSNNYWRHADDLARMIGETK